MDVDSLRAELEQHLDRNAHPDAPDGFRDRFDHVAEQIGAGEGDSPKSVLEGQLQQIRNEAEAAANAGDAKPPAKPPAGPRVRAPAAKPKVGAPPAPDAARVGGEKVVTAPAPTAGRGGDDAAPSPGFLQSYGIVLVLIVAVLAAGFFYFR